MILAKLWLAKALDLFKAAVKVLLFLSAN